MLGCNTCTYCISLADEFLCLSISCLHCSNGSVKGFNRLKAILFFATCDCFISHLAHVVIELLACSCGRHSACINVIFQSVQLLIDAFGINAGRIAEILQLEVIPDDPVGVGVTVEADGEVAILSQNDFQMVRVVAVTFLTALLYSIGIHGLEPIEGTCHSVIYPMRRTFCLLVLNVIMVITQHFDTSIIDRLCIPLISTLHDGTC